MTSYSRPVPGSSLISVIGYRFFSVPAVIVVAAAGVLSGYPFTPEDLAPLVRESGWIEVTTAAIYVLAIVAMLAVSRIDRWFFVHSAAVVAIMTARELDLHKAFTTDSVSKLRFYTGDHVGLTEKLVTGAVMLVLAAIVLRYLKYWRRLYDGIFGRSPAAYSMLLLIVLIPVTKLLDAITRILRGFDIPIFYEIQFVGLFEESLELTLPVIMLIAIAQYLIERRRAGADGRSDIAGEAAEG
ncbi:MAG: hypothetical protein V3R98_04730 [Alphaproteobacteria bacterium]